MFTNLKALIVVMVTAFAVFAMARSFCLRLISIEEFNRRRLAWFLLTIVAFLSPSFWLYALVAVPIMIWVGKQDTNPLALYFLFIYLIPPLSVEIPVVGINRLLELGQSRLLGTFILLPAVIRYAKGGPKNIKSEFLIADGLLLLYGLWQLILFVPYESSTNTLRRAFIFLLDTYLVYYSFSRLSNKIGSIRDSLGMLCLSACIFAPLALFESRKQWLLYTGIGNRWGVADTQAYILRGESLRAQVSLGHSLTLGFTLAMGVATWMCLKSMEPSRIRRSFVFGLLAVGLFFTYSRAPWLVAALSPILYFGLASKNLMGFVKSIFLLFVIAGGVALTPLGGTIIQLLPGVGSVGQETVDYRQQLAETSWRLIQLHPFVGNPFVLLDMEELRQGQGIIDLVNAYATVTLFYGVIGLLLYCGVFIAALILGFRSLLQSRSIEDMGMISLGATLISFMILTLLFMGTGGFIWAQWQLAGILMGYAALQSPRPELSRVVRQTFAI